MVDVLERQARDRAQDLARGLVDALALVEPARVVVGDRPVDRLLELEAPVADELREQLHDLHDLDVEVVAEVGRIVLGEVDVVVRLDGDDPLRPRGPPVGQVVLGEAARLLDVAHLRRGAATAPLLVHQAELDPGLLQHLRRRARDRGPVEGRLAVDEHHGLAADRQVEPLGPVAHVLLAVRLPVLDAEHGLVLELVGQPVPQLPALAVEPLVDQQRPCRADHLHGLRARPVEVAHEQRVGAAQLARAALRAVDVVVGDVLDREDALLHRDDVRVERRGRVVLVARDLGDRTRLAAELVARGEAVVGVLAPALDEFVLARVRFSPSADTADPRFSSVARSSRADHGPTVYGAPS